MAIIFLGITQCALCDKILKEGDELVSFPAISDNTNPLYRYFDAGFHKSCFENWDRKNEMQAILEKQQEEFESSDFYKEMLSKDGKPKY